MHLLYLCTAKQFNNNNVTYLAKQDGDTSTSPTVQRFLHNALCLSLAHVNWLPLPRFQMAFLVNNFVSQP